MCFSLTYIFISVFILLFHHNVYVLFFIEEIFKIITKWNFLLFLWFCLSHHPLYPILQTPVSHSVKHYQSSIGVWSRAPPWGHYKSITVYPLIFNSDFRQVNTEDGVLFLKRSFTFYYYKWKYIFIGKKLKLMQN